MPLAPPTIEDVLASPLSKFITFAANCCRYRRSFTEIYVTVFHPFLLKTKSEASNHNNPNQHQAMKGSFADEYWKAAEKLSCTFHFLRQWVTGRHDMQHATSCQCVKKSSKSANL